MVAGFLRPGRRRLATAWARAQGAPRPWRLALALCAFGGRCVARTYLLGVRGPEALRQTLVIEGEEHLTAVAGAAILLGFHLGPPRSGVMLRLLGHRVTFLGGSDHAERMAWWSDEWRPFVEPGPVTFAAGDPSRWPAVLYTGRRILLEGGKILILGDGLGKDAFDLPLLGGCWSVKTGWLTLHRLAGAPVLPVLYRLEGRRYVITVYPPLPAVGPDPPGDLEACRDRLAQLVDAYVRRVPEQCPDLVLRRRWTGPEGSTARGPRR
jgi:hypothetical protein